MDVQEACCTFVHSKINSPGHRPNGVLDHVPVSVYWFLIPVSLIWCWPGGGGAETSSLGHPWGIPGASPGHPCGIPGIPRGALGCLRALQGSVFIVFSMPQSIIEKQRFFDIAQKRPRMHSQSTLGHPTMHFGQKNVILEIHFGTCFRVFAKMTKV